MRSWHQADDLRGRKTLKVSHFRDQLVKIHDFFPLLKNLITLGLGLVLLLDSRSC